MGRGLEWPSIDTELRGDLAWYGHWAWRLLRKKCHKADLQRGLTKVRWGQAGSVDKCPCPDLWPSRLGPSKSKSSFSAWQINCVLKNSSLRWDQWLVSFLLARFSTRYTEVYVYPVWVPCFDLSWCIKQEGLWWYQDHSPMGKNEGRYVGEATRAVWSLSIDRPLRENRILFQRALAGPIRGWSKWGICSRYNRSAAGYQKLRNQILF